MLQVVVLLGVIKLANQVQVVIPVFDYSLVERIDLQHIEVAHTVAYVRGDRQHFAFDVGDRACQRVDPENVLILALLY